MGWEKDEDAVVKDGHAAEDRIESRWERRRLRRESSGDNNASDREPNRKRSQ